MTPTRPPPATSIISRSIDPGRGIILGASVFIIGIHAMIDGIPIGQAGAEAREEVQDLAIAQRATEAVGLHLEGFVVAVGVCEFFAVALAGGLGEGCEGEFGEEVAGADSEGLGDVAGEDGVGEGEGGEGDESG